MGYCHLFLNGYCYLLGKGYCYLLRKGYLRIVMYITTPCLQYTDCTTYTGDKINGSFYHYISKYHLMCT